MFFDVFCGKKTNISLFLQSNEYAYIHPGGLSTFNNNNSVVDSDSPEPYATTDILRRQQQQQMVSSSLYKYTYALISLVYCFDNFKDL